MSWVPYPLYFSIPSEAGKEGASLGSPESGVRVGEESFSCVLCFRDFIRGCPQWRETGWWAAWRKLVLGSAPTPLPRSLWVLHFFSGKCPPAPPDSNMSPNKCICPSAKIPAASRWGSCRAGPGWGTILWKEIRVSVRGGWGEVGPLLTHILASPWAADLGSPQPQVSVSALSSELLSPGEGVLTGICFGGSRGGGKRAVLLPFWEQRIVGSELEPPARGCWGLSGKMGRVRQPQTRLHSSQHACWGPWS